jgi:hypothetical protein
MDGKVGGGSEGRRKIVLGFILAASPYEAAYTKINIYIITLEKLGWTSETGRTETVGSKNPTTGMHERRQGEGETDEEFVNRAVGLARGSFGAAAKMAS